MFTTLGKRAFSAVAFATLLVCILTLTFHEPTYQALKHKTGLAHKEYDTHGFLTGNGPLVVPSKDNAEKKYAYVTLLSGTVDAPEDLAKDNYFVAVRILLWQLLHNPGTRTNHDVIVMVTPSVTQSRRDRLEKDGATVMLVDFVRGKNDGWIHGGDPRWADLMTKFRCWQLTQYERVLLLDGDSMLRSSLDGVFEDPASAQVQKTDFKHPNATVLDGQKPFPEDYVLAAGSEVWDSNHKFPPYQNGGGLKTPGYFNAGFFILKPSLAAFDYYTSLLDIEGSFETTYMEQNLLNFAHRWEGPMPWKEISYTWNVRCPNENDFEQGLVSMCVFLGHIACPRAGWWLCDSHTQPSRDIQLPHLRVRIELTVNLGTKSGGRSPTSTTTKKSSIGCERSGGR
jgi:alpha-N-acetylglucosamine transferase